jgi:hypothetical protein
MRTTQLIPQIKLNPTQLRTYRFINTTNNTQRTVTVNSLLQACGCIATLVAGTTAVSINASVRVVSVRMWGPSAYVNSGGSTNATNISITFEGYETSPNVQYGDSSLSLTYIPALNCKPPPRSAASFWHSVAPGSDTEILFSVEGDKGSIVDVQVETIYQDENSPGISVSGTGLTPGALYYSGLDTGNNYIIISPLPSI